MDLGKDRIQTLFFRLLLPTLTSMVFSSVFVVVDGMMVGRGVGPDGLAAVNLVSPLFTLSTGIGLLFGTGGSVAASAALGRGDTFSARVYTTYALRFSFVAASLTMLVVMLFPYQVATLFGAPAELQEITVSYLLPLAPALLCNIMLTAGLFFIRLDGAPRYAMWCIALGTLVNLVLDYLFIFPLQWGLFGAAFATVLGQLFSWAMMLSFLLRKAQKLKVSLKPLKLSSTPTPVNTEKHLLPHRWISYLQKLATLGFSAFLSDVAISFMVILGNLTFAHYLGVDGIAAFSIVCFLFPMVFMAYNAIVQSVQPLISYHYGQDRAKVGQAIRLALLTGIGCSVLLTGGLMWGSAQVVSLFLAPDTQAYLLAVEGLPYFSIGFLCFGINLISIGYRQSIGEGSRATVMTLVRGMILPVPCFLLLPPLMGNTGIWLAVPIAEILMCGWVIFSLRKSLFNS